MNLSHYRREVRWSVVKRVSTLSYVQPVASKPLPRPMNLELKLCMTWWRMIGRLTIRSFRLMLRINQVSCCLAKIKPLG